MENNDNKLDLLTKKIYEEGIEKAQNDAKNILQDAQNKADNIIKEAQTKAQNMMDKAQNDATNLKQKTEAEMSMSVKQAIAALKQQITHLISENISKNIATTAFNDKDFVRGLMTTIISKWNPEGSADLTVMLTADEKAEFEKYLTSKHKELLDKSLTLKPNPNQKEGFVIQPKDGSYRITFSEQMFEAFFNDYIKEYSKKLLFG